jgi:hypothetical protein
MARCARPNLFDRLVAVREQRCQNVQEFIGHWPPEKRCGGAMRPMTAA